MYWKMAYLFAVVQKYNNAARLLRVRFKVFLLIRLLMLELWEKLE